MISSPLISYDILSLSDSIFVSYHVLYLILHVAGSAEASQSIRNSGSFQSL